MEYKLNQGEKTTDLTVESTENGFTAQMGEKSYTVDATRVDGSHIRLQVRGPGGFQAVSAFVEQTPDGKVIVINGVPHLVADAEARRVRGRKKQDEGPGEVTPPTPATVARICVKEGDTVAKGDAVVKVTAMKMETTLAAPYDAAVVKINVAEGDKVMPGQILVDLEKQE